MMKLGSVKANASAKSRNRESLLSALLRESSPAYGDHVASDESLPGVLVTIPAYGVWYVSSDRCLRLHLTNPSRMSRPGKLIRRESLPLSS